MAISNKILKGFYFTTSATTTFTDDVLYFVRQDAAGKKGYLHFNGKDYGLSAAEIEDLYQKLGALSGATEALSAGTIADIAALSAGTIAANEALSGSVISYVNGKDTATNTRIDQLSAGTLSDISGLRTYVGEIPEGATQTDVISYLEALIGASDDKVDALSGATIELSGATVSAITYLTETLTVSVASASTTANTTYTISQGGTAIGTIEIPADIFVDKGTLIKVVDSSVTYTQDASVIATGTTVDLADGTYVVIKFNNTTQSTIYIDVTTLIDTYVVSGNSTNYMEIDGYTIAIKTVNVADATSASTGLADAWQVKQYVDGKETTTVSKINELSAATISSIEVNGVSATVTNNAATVTVDSDDIKIGTAIEYSGQTIADSADTVTDAMNAIIGQMVDNEKVTAKALVDLRTDVDAISATTANAVQSVNGHSGTTVVLDAADVNLHAGIAGNDIIAAATTSDSTQTVLSNIYTALGKANTITSTGKTVNVTANADGTKNVEVNLEEATTATVQAGHVAIEKTSGGALYGVIYCDGDDVTPAS